VCGDEWGKPPAPSGGQKGDYGQKKEILLVKYRGKTSMAGEMQTKEPILHKEVTRPTTSRGEPLQGSILRDPSGEEQTSGSSHGNCGENSDRLTTREGDLRERQILQEKKGSTAHGI